MDLAILSMCKTNYIFEKVVAKHFGAEIWLLREY